MFDQFTCHIPLTPQPSRKQDFMDFSKESNHSYTKKKIGDYAYYLNDLIGSGYSSNVYKCFKQSEPHVIYAVKVIRLNKLAKSNLNMLQNEIKILQTLDHPNIIKFHNVTYTQNNCYIVTDYCEGGTLQDHIDKQKSIKFQEVFEQLIQGCKFLAEHLIVHRDIKPANVFLKQGLWKIGDFGFARFLQSKQTVVKEMFKVGSPLYMPPETLKESLYSLKNDSFALGVLLFYLLTRQYPWPGTNNSQLLQMYQKCEFPSKILRCLSEFIRDTIENLCKLNIQERIYVWDIKAQIKNPEIEKTQSLLKRLHNFYQKLYPQLPDSDIQQVNEDDQSSVVNILREKIDFNIVQKLKICKIIHYFNLNIQQLEQLEQIKIQFKRILNMLILSFGWLESDTSAKYVNQFSCEGYNHCETVKQIKNIRIIISNQIKSIEVNVPVQNKIVQIIRLKLIQFSYILKLILSKKSAKLKKFINKTILHPDFSKVFMFPAQIQQIQKLVTKLN